LERVSIGISAKKPAKPARERGIMHPKAAESSERRLLTT
jgi:hypothetical protein